MAVMETVEVQTCRDCGLEKPLTSEYYNRNGFGADGRELWKRICNVCRAERRAAERAAMSDEEMARVREVGKITRRAQRATAEGRRRDAEISRRWRERMHADEERAAAHREARRLQARVRREREGAFLPQLSADTGHELPDLPARPLMEKVLKLIERTNAAHGWFDPLNRGAVGGTKEVCVQVGLAERTISAWRMGERLVVEFDVADRVLQRAGWLWWDVYNEESVRLPIFSVVKRVRRKAKNRGKPDRWVCLPGRRYGDRGSIPRLDVEGYEVTDWEALARVERIFTGEGVELEDVQPPPQTIEEYREKRPVRWPSNKRARQKPERQQVAA